MTLPRKYIKFTMMTIISLVISLPIWASAAEVGNFTRIVDRVDYQKGETGPLTPAKVTAPVEEKDIINTYEVSRAQVEFRDKTLISIAPKSKVTIDSYMYDPSKFEAHGELNLIQGVMKVVVPTLETGGKKEFNIKTSTATMGVRGTEFIVISGENFSVVYATHGKICIKNLKDSGDYSVRRVAPGEPEEEEEVCLDPGTMSVILKGQAPTTPMPASAGVLKQAEGLVATGVSTTNANVCVVGTLPGVNLVTVGNNLMAQGVNLQDVQTSLTSVCFVGTYTYTPPAPPAPVVGVGPNPPPSGQGGTVPSPGGTVPSPSVGGGTASPSS